MDLVGEESLVAWNEEQGRLHCGSSKEALKDQESSLMQPGTIFGWRRLQRKE
jgi:hypothetical protein